MTIVLLSLKAKSEPSSRELPTLHKDPRQTSELSHYQVVRILSMEPFTMFVSSAYLILATIQLIQSIVSCVSNDQEEGQANASLARMEQRFDTVIPLITAMAANSQAQDGNVPDPIRCGICHFPFTGPRRVECFTRHVCMASKF